jgi:hypothetical protein
MTIFDESLYSHWKKDLTADELVTVVVDEFACLGLEIFNQTDLPLYPLLISSTSIV